MGERGASEERQTAQEQIRSTDAGYLDKQRGRERDRPTEDPSLLDEAFELGCPVLLELPPLKMDLPFLPSLGEGPSGLGCLGRRSPCSHGPGGILRCLRTRGWAQPPREPQASSPGSFPLLMSADAAASLPRPESKARDQQ